MPPTISSEPFHTLAAALKEGGFAAHSARLQSVLDGLWTTSSEFLAELGVVVIAIRKECRPLTSNQKALVKECLKQVRKAWPGFGLFSFFLFWQ
jgi:hypothetical protein